MRFADSVERWRADVARFLAESGAPAALVDKVLWVINYESGGNPYAVGDNGAAIGLLQIHDSTSISGRPTAAQLLDPLFNIRYAIQSLGISSGNFSAWGENTLYNGKPFGALGNHPYPTDVKLDFPGIPGVPNIPGTGFIPGVSDMPLIPGLPFNLGDLFGAGGKGFDAAKALPAVLGQIAHIFAWLLDPRHWLRLFFISAGGVLIIGGAYIYVRGNDAIGDAARIGASAA